MSQVDKVGSVSEISPETLSFVRVSMRSYARPGWPDYQDLGNWDENFPL